MAYYPPPNQGQDYSVSYYPSPNQGQAGFNSPGPYVNEPPVQYNKPAPFPIDQYGGPPSSYPASSQYPPSQQYVPPGQYPPMGPPYGQPGQPGQPMGQNYGQPEYGGQPVMNQPAAQFGGEGDWMATPRGPANILPGLEYLISLSSLFVKQKVNILETLIGFEENNKFTIKNDRGEKLYWAVEDSEVCTRNICGKLRPFEMKILDSQEREVIRINRPLACISCCFPCCLQSVQVYAPPGNFIGSVHQVWSMFYPKFIVKNADGETVLRIKGPFCASGCGHQEFQILSEDGKVIVGKISKEWSGVLREFFTDADFFGISFPVDLDVKIKAVLLGALFLIDAMFFENNNDSPGLLCC